MGRRRALLTTCVAAIAAAAAAALVLPRAQAAHFADPENAALVQQGKVLYARSCASCHGRRLQGQLLWQVRDAFAGRRAPAHDQTGHTWQHSDEDLFQMVKQGRFPTTPSSVKSYMPAYAGTLDDTQILATIAYIKATWPLGLRVSQALLNPGYMGLPPDADQVEWRLPPTCQAALQRAGPAVGFSIGGVPPRPVR